MLNVLIVTDSAAWFPDHSVIGSPHLKVVPNHVHLEGRELLETVDISSRDVWDIARTSQLPPRISPPTAMDFLRVFQAASTLFEGIVSIHSSAAMFTSYRNGQIAADRITGRCEFALIDSQALCVPQGLLVQEALKMLPVIETFDDLVREIRNTVARLFAIYYVESTDTLLHNGIVSAEHSVLASMLGVKPLLTLDEGRIVTTAKGRTRSQVVDQLVEFALGFDDFEAGVVVQPEVTQRSETTRMLLNRLTDAFPGRSFVTSGYAPALAAIVGPQAGGLVILGSEAGETHGFIED